MQQKWCSGCYTSKSLEEFHRCRSNPDGWQYKCKECNRVVRLILKDKHNARRRELRRANAQTEKLVRARSYRRNAETNRKRNRLWRKLNPEKQSAACKQWRRLNPERVLQHNNDRRARLAGCVGKFTPVEWKQKCKEYDHRCAYCRQRRLLTRHHVMPVSRGGANTIDNIVPACRRCNCRIKTKVVQPGERIP